MTTFTDASPKLKMAKPPPPPPPPRSSSLKNEVANNDENDPLQTPRSRKPIFKLSPRLEEESPVSSDKSHSDKSFIEKEAELLLNGKMNPSKSMTAFLNNENLPLECDTQDDTPDKLRKRSITELGGPNPLAKSSTTPLQNCQAYFETDF